MTDYQLFAILFAIMIQTAALCRNERSRNVTLFLSAVFGFTAILLKL